jgi:hypothetical protein
VAAGAGGGIVRAVPHYYILDHAGEPVGCDDVTVWGAWMQADENVIVAQEDVGDFRVSTVFLGIDHAFGGGPPVLWETIIFGPGGTCLDGYPRRYRSRAEAVEWHADALAEAHRRTRPPLSLVP